MLACLFNGFYVEAAEAQAIRRSLALKHTRLSVPENLWTPESARKLS